jgi:hypothetical protein
VLALLLVHLEYSFEEVIQKEDNKYTFQDITKILSKEKSPQFPTDSALLSYEKFVLLVEMV